MLSVVGSLVQIGTPDGDTLDFTKDATTGTGATFAPEAGDETLRLEYVSSGDKYLLTDGDGNVTTFTRVTGAAAGLYNPHRPSRSAPVTLRRFRGRKSPSTPPTS